MAQNYLSPTASAVDISVVITTRNRSSRLAETLANLSRQQISECVWEVIVVDNGSTDDTSDALEVGRNDLPLRALYFEPPGKCRAQNFALAQARGELVVFTDDDVSFEPGWLDALSYAAERWPRADLFGGAIRVRLVDGIPGWLDNKPGREIVTRHCAHYHPRDDEGMTDVPPIGPNMAVRQRALTDIRFDENVGPDGTPDYIKGGDTDLNQALMMRGRRCVFVPAAVVYHHAYADQLNLDALALGAYRRGRKNAYLYARETGICVFGAPPGLWIKLAKQWMRYRLHALRAPLLRYEVSMKYHYRRGYIRQLRQRNTTTHMG